MSALAVIKNTMPGLSMSWHSAEWLSLAQAAAGAAAVVGAFGVVFLQKRFQEKEKLSLASADRLKATEVSLLVAKMALSNAENLYSHLVCDLTEERRELAIDVLTDSRGAIDRLDLRNLELKAIKLLFGIRSNLTKLISLCRRIESENFDNLPESTKTLIEITARMIGRDVDSLEKMKNALE
ncbi:hypothetical protein [Burkholderia glumae]|uniref:hypothetical protein n=1 Tax=Burkholderia glumae TaxID=337 RepID=UPI0012FC349C|nr:hypothetical protein [Burkholderia glumae]MCM2544260.1 hypothetical protein [Burkholderia glumae]